MKLNPSKAATLLLFGKIEMISRKYGRKRDVVITLSYYPIFHFNSAYAYFVKHDCLKPKKSVTISIHIFWRVR